MFYVAFLIMLTTLTVVMANSWKDKDKSKDTFDVLAIPKYTIIIISVFHIIKELFQIWDEVRQPSVSTCFGHSGYILFPTTIVILLIVVINTIIIVDSISYRDPLHLFFIMNIIILIVIMIMTMTMIKIMIMIMITIITTLLDKGSKNLPNIYIGAVYLFILR